MGGAQAMSRVIAGLGFRRDVGADAILAVLREAGARCGRSIDALAVPDFKADEPGMLDAAGRLGLPVIRVGRAALRGEQGRCLTRSDAALAATGLASVAEAAALAAAGADCRLLLARISLPRATCALAEGT
jgi:cobalt-precorrin 5A hydrolase